VFENMFTRFYTIHERDRQPDGQTDGQKLHDGIGRSLYFWQLNRVCTIVTCHAMT